MDQPTTHDEILARWQRRMLLVGIVALAACTADMAWPALAYLVRSGQMPERLSEFLRPQAWLQAYLLAFIFWMSVAVGCLALAMLHQLVHGAWGLATERLFLAGAATLPLVAVMFVPLALGIRHLYPWAEVSSAAAQHELGHKALYLNEQAVVGRAVLYFVLWILFAWVLRRWSRRRDDAADDRLTLNIRRLSAGGLVVLSLTVTFAAIDWIMSLEPDWYSTMYGMSIAVGGVLLGLAFAINVLARVDGDAPLAEVAAPRVYNDLGSLLLAFVILWTYLAFSQFLIIWSGNTLEEITWYLRRLDQGWQWLALAVVLLHFVAPFLLLLSKDRKRRPRALAAVACGLLCIDYVYLLWVIAPAFHRQPYSIPWLDIQLPGIHWLDVVMPLGVGGLWMWCFFRNARGAPLVGPNDPAWVKLRPENAGGGDD